MMRNRLQEDSQAPGDTMKPTSKSNQHEVAPLIPQAIEHRALDQASNNEAVRQASKHEVILEENVMRMLGHMIASH